MKIKFNITAKKTVGLFMPYGYPKLIFKEGEVKDVPQVLGKKLLSEYPNNLRELGLIIPIPNYEKKKIALELGYNGALGYKNKDLNDFLLSNGYKEE